MTSRGRGAHVAKSHAENVVPVGRTTGEEDLAECAPDGIALIDAHGAFVRLNAAGIMLCARPVGALIGASAPFELVQDVSPDALGLLDDGVTEQVCGWGAADGRRLEFAYRSRPLPGDPSMR